MCCAGLIAFAELRATKREWDLLWNAPTEKLVAQYRAAGGGVPVAPGTVPRPVDADQTRGMQFKLCSLLHVHQYGMSFTFDFAKYAQKTHTETICGLMNISKESLGVVLIADLVFLGLRYVSGADCDWHGRRVHCPLPSQYKRVLEYLSRYGIR